MSKLKIYMDCCCYNRIFDDRSYPNIYLDRNSVMIILELAEKGMFELVGSQVLFKEINQTPSLQRREKLQVLYSLCRDEIQMTKDIAVRALEIRNQSNIRMNDSLHLASCELANIDVFLTVDRKFKNNANRLPARITVMGPTEWLLEVINGYND